MATPTLEEIEEQVEWLRANKERIRQHTAFGDDNWAAVEAQIAVLEDGLDEDNIFNRDFGGHEENAALEARAWADGDPDAEAPSESWAPLLS